MSQQTLDERQRESILRKVARIVQEKHYDPQFDTARWQSLVERQWAHVVQANDPVAFEQSLHALVQQVGIPGTGFFHQTRAPKLPQNAVTKAAQFCNADQCYPSAQSSDEADVFFAKIRPDVGWLRVVRFPGAVGVDVAREMSRAVEALADCNRLILDLRGHEGGGLAFLRLMSFLTSQRLPVGYSITRHRADRGYTKETLPRFQDIPSHKSKLLWLTLRYGFVDNSVAIFTEPLGPRRFHGKTVMLVDGTTLGAGERVAAFAKENGLATIVGTRTPGRLICSRSFSLKGGYVLRVPARAWFTWKGEVLEQKGVVPDVSIAETNRQKDLVSDTPLRTALDVVNSL